LQRLSQIGGSTAVKTQSNGFQGQKFNMINILTEDYKIKQVAKSKLPECDVLHNYDKDSTNVLYTSNIRAAQQTEH
jgi:hypothetical protein